MEQEYEIKLKGYSIFKIWGYHQIRPCDSYFKMGRVTLDEKIWDFIQIYGVTRINVKFKFLSEWKDSFVYELINLEILKGNK